MINQVKEYLLNHRKAFYGLIAIVAVILFVSVARILFLDGETKKEIAASEGMPTYTAEISSKQESIIGDYTDDIKEIISILSGNVWIDKAGAKNLTFNDREYVERSNGEESIKSFAICSFEKIDSGQATSSNNPLGVEHRMTCLISGDIYVQLSMFINYVDSSSNSEVSGVVLNSKKMFSNCEEYTRAKRADTLVLENWNKDNDKFIDYKYDKLYETLENHCYKFYPQISSVIWNKKIVMDFENDAVVLTFQIPLKSPKYIDVYYYKAEGNFEIVKSKSY